MDGELKGLQGPWLNVKCRSLLENGIGGGSVAGTIPAACGLTEKPKEQIIDIDASDIDNERAGLRLWNILKIFTVSISWWRYQTWVHDMFMDKEKDTITVKGARDVKTLL
ncbi:hypothetical protein RIF29_18839 [Crotalaria pallida]|uniref:Uncharacterized protein n=1 Tax=Crotalaria pallida TaxID=3830 RepID=A0AAN9I4Z2_CROPI